jgi:transposase
VEDEDYQLRYERVAGIDVAKAKADVCTRLPPAREGGRRVSRAETIAATAREVLALAGRLIADGVEVVVMESTSDYWRIWLRREASCCISGLAGRNLEDIPGSDGLLKIRKVKGTIACQETSGRADAYGRDAGKTRVIWLKLYCLNPNLQKG